MRFETLRDREVTTTRQKILSCGVAMASGKNDPRLLDIGCGDGDLTIEFAAKLGTKECYGVDNDEEMLQKALKRGITVGEVDLNSGLIPFPDDFFDIILCHQVAEHLTNPDNLFQEMQRVLRTDGQCLLSVPNLCSLHNRVLVLFGQHPTVISPSTRFSFGNFIQKGEELEEAEGHRHNTAFSPAGLKEMLRFYGFRIEHYYGSGLHPFSNGIAKLLLRLFPGLGITQIAVASKR